jgi:hypothetical protein
MNMLINYNKYEVNELVFIQLPSSKFEPQIQPPSNIHVFATTYQCNPRG